MPQLSRRELLLGGSPPQENSEKTTPLQPSKVDSSTAKRPDILSRREFNFLLWFITASATLGFNPFQQKTKAQQERQTNHERKAEEARRIIDRINLEFGDVIHLEANELGHPPNTYFLAYLYHYLEAVRDRTNFFDQNRQQSEVIIIRLLPKLEGEERGASCRCFADDEEQDVIMIYIEDSVEDSPDFFLSNTSRMDALLGHEIGHETHLEMVARFYYEIDEFVIQKLLLDFKLDLDHQRFSRTSPGRDEADELKRYIHLDKPDNIFIAYPAFLENSVSAFNLPERVREELIGGVLASAVLHQTKENFYAQFREKMIFKLKEAAIVLLLTLARQGLESFSLSRVENMPKSLQNLWRILQDSQAVEVEENNQRQEAVIQGRNGERFEVIEIDGQFQLGSMIRGPQTETDLTDDELYQRAVRTFNQNFEFNLRELETVPPYIVKLNGKEIRPIWIIDQLEGITFTETNVAPSDFNELNGVLHDYASANIDACIARIGQEMWGFSWYDNAGQPQLPDVAPFEDLTYSRINLPVSFEITDIEPNTDEPYIYQDPSIVETVEAMKQRVLAMSQQS